MKALCSIVITFFSFNLLAKPAAYFDSNESILFKQKRVVVEDNEVRSGIFGYSGLEEAMKKNAVAAEYAKSAKCYSTWASGLILGGIALAGGYTLVTKNKKDSSGEIIYNSDTAFGILGLGLVPGIIMGGLAHTKLHRAINQYNGVYEGQEAGDFKDDGVNEEPREPETVEDTTQLYIFPTLNGLSLALTF